MKKLLFVVGVLLLIQSVGMSDWLIQVKVEGFEYERNLNLEMALIMDVIRKDIAKYNDPNNFLWFTPEHPQGAYFVERWNELKDVVMSLIAREPYTFVGIYVPGFELHQKMIPYIYAEKRFTRPNEHGDPENLQQRNFDLSLNRSIIAQAYNQKQAYFTTNIRRVVESSDLHEASLAYQQKAGVRGYFAYPLLNGPTPIGVLVIATMEPGITEEQFFRIQQYSTAIIWLVVETYDLMMNPEKAGR